ncbi:MAG: hypothetical protein GXP17_03470 [Gammaproteobacteria bacterium]|nr:hypothetical protein [Gammaproteobacteria bacterium]
MHTEFFVAPRGWAHSDWHGDFFPDDLPDDWRLSYFSNEFRAVVLPESDWLGMAVVEIERWVSDTPEAFLFYLEIESLTVDWSRVAELIQPIGGQLGGFILRPDAVDEDLALMASSLDSATALAPVSLLLPEGMEPSVSGLSLVTKCGVELGWRAQTGIPYWRGGGLAVTHVPSNVNDTPRQWRETIEASLAGGSGGAHRVMLVVLEGSAPKLDHLRAAVMIGDMLALPLIQR